MELARKCLWVLVVLFIIATLTSALAPSVPVTATYVSILVAFALIHGALRYEISGIVAFAVLCLIVSNLFENLGVATGFPFGNYHYTDVLGYKLFHVPILIGPTYLGVGYLSWVMAAILAGDVRRDADPLDVFATPVIAAFIMVLWDICLDPGASTAEKWWIWHDSGGFFGVPLSNYLGWFLTVYVFMQAFAIYLAGRAPAPEIAQPPSYYVQAILMYALVAGLFVLNYLVKEFSFVTDAKGVTWRTADIAETAAMTAIFTMLFVAVLATIGLIRKNERN
jgi:putative membrane protein